MPWIISTPTVYNFRIYKSWIYNSRFYNSRMMPWTISTPTVYTSRGADCRTVHRMRPSNMWPWPVATCETCSLFSLFQEMFRSLLLCSFGFDICYCYAYFLSSYIRWVKLLLWRRPYKDSLWDGMACGAFWALKFRLKPENLNQMIYDRLRFNFQTIYVYLMFIKLD